MLAWIIDRADQLTSRHYTRPLETMLDNTPDHFTHKWLLAFCRIGSTRVKTVNAIHDSINLYNNT
jgi:hypothetical protein